MNTEISEMTILNSFELDNIQGGGWRKAVDETCEYINFFWAGAPLIKVLPNVVFMPSLFCAGWWLAGKI